MNNPIKGVPFNLRSKRVKPILQNEDAECGLACIAMVLNYYDYDIDLATLRRRYNVSNRGTNLAQLINVAHAHGLNSRPAKVKIEDLVRVRTPCILHWDMNHFVILSSITKSRVEIIDPSRGLRTLRKGELEDKYTGIVLELAPSPDFTPKRERQKISLLALTGDTRGILKTALQILGIAFALELVVLLLPFQMQIVMDHVLVTQDRAFLAWVTAGFLSVVIMQSVLTVLRSWMLGWFGANISAQWAANLASHLIRLPLGFYVKRDVGEIMSRFSSVQYIQTTLTGSFVEVLLSGITGTLSFIIICIYSWKLGIALLIGVSLYFALRLALYRRQAAANESQMAYMAKQQRLLIEVVRGAQTIKLANKEGERSARLAEETYAAAGQAMLSQRFGQLFGGLNQGIVGIQRVLLISFGALITIRGDFTVGMFIAFLGYADIFISRITMLTDKAFEFRLLGVHAERIADIALHPSEVTNGLGYNGDDFQASLQLRALGFKYGTDDPWILRNLNLSVAQGESVAIIGPSGCGKTTLVKLLVGLLEPTEGSISIGNIPIEKYGLSNYREMVGTVMQDDHLFAGSIAENISFFDPASSMERIAIAAKLAHVHDEIIAMTMGYESKVGDMGSSLSGGQRQRIILARALYRNPKVLVLDEATSHLDVALERMINATIQRERMTRIIIAHRPETIASADRVFDLGGNTAGMLKHGDIELRRT